MAIDRISVQGQPVQVLLRAALLTMDQDDARNLVRPMDAAELKALRTAAELLTEAAAAEIIRRGNR